ncbi:MAG: MFS transporter [Candidatus Izemoplasma sp.]|nr:MFS transporter [Candidatus Izemoplasma sp.]
MSRLEKQSYFAYLWHGVFLALTMSMLDLNTVFPTLVDTLTSQPIVFGILYSMMLGVPLVFNIVFSHHLRKIIYKKKFLIMGMYLRGIAFLGMAIMTYYFALSNPSLTIASYFIFVFMFSISAGFAGISYSDILGKTIQRENRTTLYSIKQLLSAVAGIIGGLIITRIFNLGIAFPMNYTISLMIGFIGLFIASIGFWILKEPPSIIGETTTTFGDYIKEIPTVLKTDLSFKRYIVVENLSSFSIMILPFYIIYAKNVFNLENRYIGIYLLIQIIGTVVSNIIWGLIAKKTSAKRVVLVCILLGGTNPLIALILGMTSPILYGIIFFILGFTISGRKVGFEPFLLDLSPDAKRVQYLGIRGSLNVLVVLLPLAGALFIDYIGYTVTFSIVFAVMMLAAILLTGIDKQVIEDCQ